MPKEPKPLQPLIPLEELQVIVAQIARTPKDGVKKEPPGPPTRGSPEKA